MTTTSTTPTTPASTATSSPPTAESEREISFEHLVAGRLALQVLRNQLDTQIAGLHAQLLVAESQLRQTEDMLERAEAKLNRQHPDKVVSRDASWSPPRARSRARVGAEPEQKRSRPRR